MYKFDPLPGSEHYLDIIRDAEQRNKLPENLLANLIAIESGYDPKAESPAGAIGLCQIIPKWHPNVDPWNPIASIYYAASYLNKLFKRFKNWDMVLAAYNWGPTNVRKYGMEMIPAETRDYIEQFELMRV